MNILPKTADTMQDVLTDSADIIAVQTGFVKRKRKLTGSNFTQMLVFGWLDNPDATLDELTQTGVDIGIDISPQGLEKRFNQQAANFLHRVLEEAVNTVIAADPVAIPVLQRFNGVYLQDTRCYLMCLQFSGADTPETVYTGCGGSTSENTSSSVKLQTRLDLNAGKLNGPYLQSGSEHDRNSCLLKESLPEGSLWITDLGYFSLKEFAEHNADGKYWLSKVNSQCDLYDKDGERWDLVGFLELSIPTNSFIFIGTILLIIITPQPHSHDWWCSLA
jgi:hypothetical protein